MSWFDTSGFANIAKSALREAQRTIDKALDIKDEDLTNSAPIDTNSDDFFGTWVAAPSDHGPRLQASVWGSFTGSFFEPKDAPQSPTIESLDDSVDPSVEHFSGSKLVVVQRRDEPFSVDSGNRLSVASLESGSESVECATSPESEPNSSEHSTTDSNRQPTSESLEILVDSLTSPSSIEVIAAEDKTEEFASPLCSPLVEELLANALKIAKPVSESVEVIPDDVEEDTMSYTSISESTSASVLDQNNVFNLKPAQKMLKDTFHANMMESEAFASPEKNFADAITTPPNRGALHLPLLLVDTQPQSSRADLTAILAANTNIIDIPSHESVEAPAEDEGSQSDRTIIAKESSLDSSSDTSILEPDFLKNLIADAMSDQTPIAIEKHLMDLSQKMLDSSADKSNIALENISISQLDMPPREISPLSSESRSDLVKIGSDHTSGHTSGDDLETTTSSDIEIISSPNGDSSSTQSRHSPAKGAPRALKCDDKKIELLCKMTMRKAKGHNRELSEASSISDDLEVERLVRRIAEITEILESRESKLIDMNRRNAEVQELNASLKQQLDLMLSKQLESSDLSQVTEEYTQRMSALEKKFQQAIREKDTLKKQLAQSKLESAARMSKSELDDVVGEKDEIIRELRQEGEILSKQQLQHSNIIKKLRAKEKENEATIKNQKETMEDLTSEMDRLKRSLTAKEEVERTQIEAVHQLTAKNKKLENELSKIQSNHDDLNQKYETVKKSLDAAKKELVDKNRTGSELIAREHKLESLENEKRMTESQNAAIINEIDDLRARLRQLDYDFVKKEQILRRENADLVQRLEDAEARNEELSQSVLEVSKPLVRQLDSLQATHSLKMAHFEKTEQELALKINELQGRLQSSLHSERVVKDESVSLRSKVSDMESELGSLKHQNELLKMDAERLKTEHQISEQDLKRQLDELSDKLKQEKQKRDEIKRQITAEQEQAMQKSIESVKSTPIVPESEMFEQNSLRDSSNSPTLSLGKVSVAESFGSLWSQDESLDINNAPSRYTNMFEMQMLQSNLKQREGEVKQLQWELNRREQERSLLNSEISTLLTRVDDLEAKIKETNCLKGQFGELQQQYDTLCQLYGEKVEENEELKLDLQDVKEMYKLQIDELLKQQKLNI